MDNIKSIPGQSNITDRLIDVIKNLPLNRQTEFLDALEKEKPEKPVENEHRRHSRKDVLLPVDYASYDKFFREFIRDISEGGVFIETQNPLMIGQKIAMTFMTTDERHHFKMNGKIVRDVKNGIGVKFDDTTPEQAIQIKAFISMM
jgi:Tfp pilus assembly protein PilZ